MLQWLRRLLGPAIPPNVVVAAVLAHHKWEVPASVSIAQWALESGWGRHVPPNSNNPFGIKASMTDPHVEAWTTEVYNGRTVRIMARFRKYASLAQAFDAHGQLLSTKYPRAMACASNPLAFAYALTGRYATDPKYGSKLVQIMKQYKLLQYDAE